MLATSRWVRWGAPLAVVLLAAVLRLWNLGAPHALVFDETFYVKDAWSLFNNGYESTWPADANVLFEAGQTNIFTTDPSFVVHPPLGKWLIALGMNLLGPGTPWGWRLATVVVGVLAVVLIMLVARKLFQSRLLALIAGFLLAIDGHAIVMSRVALLDNFVMFFALLGVGAVLMDREWHSMRLAGRLAGLVDPGWGPTLWWRPWLIAAGLAFGLTSSVKWSGLYFLAAFGLYLVVVDALARRRNGVSFWASAAILKQAPATFLLLVPVAVVTFLVSWTGWFVTRGGYYREWSDSTGAAWTGPFAWVPHTLQSFWHYQTAAYTYHVGLATPHPYEANPLTWLFMIRPTSMYYRGSSQGEFGCQFQNCSEAITSVGNPLIWWAATAALFYLVYRLARYREWRVGFILMGMVAGYLPWLMYLNRTVFQFYTIAFEPYLLLGLTFVIGMLLGRIPDLARPVRRHSAHSQVSEYDAQPRSGALVGVAVGLGVALALTAFFFPVWTGMQTPFVFWQLHIWMPSWR
ncbi:phospholipid carrier-dependent glycosyltransferase [Cryobacterium sp. PH31-O1]|uniref:dolichyl-phosphate-mannose--protein mannosyltransferase n=1 Tax=Cryobacterium sp. PH31-O1 TaxID=3046306 RepID=UPI0024B8F946|nr:phospholipid carrier-dependent glycosyltransferase [Cryobacterium sp. PH31-O1]MDJ0339177.1 phospholipid carrier-dependent glycosyltransferase [Cryobacterium sp. PH31-O1]